MLKNKKYLLIAATLVGSFLLPAVANASQLNQAGIRLGRLGNGASVSNDALTTFKLNTTPTSVAEVIMTFPSGFNITAGTPTVSTTGFPTVPAGITAPPGTLTASATSAGAGLGGTITVSGLTSASLNNTTLYGFDIPTGTITNPTTAGQYNLSVASATSTGVVIDTTSTPTYIYGSAANEDQVTVNASVAANFSFALSANSDTVPTVNPTSTQTSPGVTMTVGTNSPLGYTAYVRSANGALNSATSPGTPITSSGYSTTAPVTMTPGTTNYGLAPSTGTVCTTCTGTLTYTPTYTVTSTQAGPFNGTNFAAFVSRSGYTNSDQVLLQERVDVSNTVGYAHDYADTLTVVAAGNY